MYVLAIGRARCMQCSIQQTKAGSMVGPTASQISRRPIPSRPVVQTPLNPQTIRTLLLYYYLVTYTNTLPWQEKQLTSPIGISFTHTHPLRTAILGDITAHAWALPLRRWAATAILGKNIETSQTATCSLGLTINILSGLKSLPSSKNSTTYYQV